jgi:hypothetical protein
MTHAALLLGALAIVIALASPGFSQLNVFNFLAFVVGVLSVSGIGITLWRIELRSRRLLAPLFWYCLISNLLLLIAMCVLLLHTQSLPAASKSDVPIPATPNDI